MRTDADGKERSVRRSAHAEKPRSLSERFSSINQQHSRTGSKSGIVKMAGVEGASTKGRRPERRGRGGRGGKFRRAGPPKKENLDADLERYMMGDSEAGKAILDNDLDEYMKDAEIGQKIAA